jgi:hypothetical protein
MLWLLACATVGTMQTADTVGRGRTQVGVEPAAWSAGVEGVGITLPYGGISARYGIHEHVDLGLRLGTGGTELMGKWQLVKAPAFSLAVQGSVGGYGFGIGGTDLGFVVAQAGPIAGFNLGPHQIVVGPKVHDWSAFGEVGKISANGHVLSLGTSVGVAFRLGPRVRILPEGAWVAPVWMGGDTSFTEGASGPGMGGVLSQYSLAFLFDLGPMPGDI